ncbi:hypothetical protein J6590_092322 [Homalodisca vitripennis]|nr:hypothetical protein J6590_092322 [Homalodisca vitripennis]
MQAWPKNTLQRQTVGNFFSRQDRFRLTPCSFHQQGIVRAAVGAASDVGLAFGASLGDGALQPRLASYIINLDQWARGPGPRCEVLIAGTNIRQSVRRVTYTINNRDTLLLGKLTLSTLWPPCRTVKI